MAVLDRYIEAMATNSAEELLFTSGKVVELVVGSHSTPLSASPATKEQLLGMAAEALGADFLSRLVSGQAAFSYQSPVGMMSVTVAQTGGGLALRVQPGAPAPSAEPISIPVVQSSTSPFVEPVIARASVSSPAAPKEWTEAGPRHLDELFNQIIDLGASDLHLKTDKIPMVRFEGSMQSLPGWGELSGDVLRRLITEIMPARNLKEFEETNDTDFAYELPRARMRCNIFRDIAGIGAVFRQIPTKVRTAEELGLPPAVLAMCALNKGLVVVTGPTGSGKSTTLAAMVNWVNENRDDHLITIEDPVEFVHHDKRCHINQREVGIQTKSYKAALRAALREDPDIVLVGELRDLETVAIALETAETGHLVFATLHTNTAASTVDRLIDQFPADRQAQVRAMLSESLKGVVAQTLCRKKGGGRVAALEILVVNNAISNLIREGKTHQIASAMQTGKSLGMQTLNDALLELVQAGAVEPQDAYSRAVNKKDFVLMLGRSGFKGDWAE